MSVVFIRGHLGFCCSRSCWCLVCGNSASVKRFAGKMVSEMTCNVSSGTSWQGVYNSWKSWKSPWICMVSWKFLCKMSMIDCIGFQSWWNWVVDRLFKKLVALFVFAMAPMLCISCFCSIFRQTSRFGTLHSRPKQCKHVLDFSWNPSWNLLEMSWNFVQLNL